MPPSRPSTVVERLDALYEYDREPVSEDRLHGWKTFIAMFSSEHIAGTEFVLGPILVAHGVTAFDVFVGLAVGNPLGDRGRSVGNCRHPVGNTGLLTKVIPLPAVELLWSLWRLVPRDPANHLGRSLGLCAARA